METMFLGDWLDLHPAVLAAITLLAGFALAWMLKRGAAIFVGWINRISAGDAEPAVSAKFEQMLQQFVFWAILLITAVACLYLLGGEQSNYLDALWTGVTRVLVAASIVAVGHVVGVLARHLANGLSQHLDMPVLPRLAYLLIIIVALVMALAHLGLDVSLITFGALVAGGVFLASIGLAFALGARTLVANLAAQSEMGRYRPGDRLRVDGVEGTVLEIDRTGLVLATPEGSSRIPAARFADSTVVLLQELQRDDG
jgi:small-conductance mechanosensitive channel